LSKILIAVKSCHDDLDKGCHDTILKTWGRDLSDLRFFVGCERPTWGQTWYDGFHEKTIDIDVADDYDHLPQKTRRILQWSLEQGYDFTFLCDVDTFLEPDRLMKTGFEKYDYSGRFGSSPAIGSQFDFKDGRGIRHEHCHPWASGGFGYFVSQKAAREVVLVESKIWAEDMYVGQVMGPLIQCGDIEAADLPNFENYASFHYPAHKLGWNRQRMQEWMREMNGGR
jgi:hypothetical protein